MMTLNPPFSNKGLGLIVCADDFGVSSGVNEAIIRLLKQERITAVSCMVSGKAWPQGAAVLKDLRAVADIGLHLCYEQMPFNRLLALAYTKRLSQKAILAAFKSQLDNFIESMGGFPDYIDGHRHIHQLPVLRSALMALIEEPRLNKIYIRNSASGLDDIFKRRISILKNILITLPGRSLKKDLTDKRIPTNNDFLGIYDFNAPHDPAKIFEKLLRTVNKINSVLVSHPSSAGKSLNGHHIFDKNRLEEFRYLESDQYKETLERCGLYPARFIF